MPYDYRRQAPVNRPRLKYPRRIRRRRRIIGMLTIIVILAVLIGYSVTLIKSPTKNVVATTTTSVPKPSTTATDTSTGAETWRVVWGAPMAWGNNIVTNASLREIIKSPTAGSALEIQISNLFGTAPLNLEDLNIAEVSSGANLIQSTMSPLTFSGSTSVSVPVGQQLLSDPIQMNVSEGETLAVSFYVLGSDLVTIHPCCTVGKNSFFTPNGRPNVANSTSGAAFGYSSPYPRFVDAMFLEQGSAQASSAGSIVIIGDSITDGYNSATRWPDFLQDRIDKLPVNQQRAVVNEGITANALLSSPPLPRDDSKDGGGPSGLSRLNMDALSFPGVGTVVLFLGTNDLWFGATATQLIQGMQQFISEVKAAGIQVIGVTLLPRMTSMKEIWTPLQQSYLEQVNNWILTSGSFNAVINLTSVISDTYNGQCSPTTIFPPYNSGDNLHPSPAGDLAMADAVPGNLFGFSNLPLLNPMVAATPTPGCLGVTGIPSSAQLQQQLGN